LTLNWGKGNSTTIFLKKGKGNNLGERPLGKKSGKMFDLPKKDEAVPQEKRKER